MSIKLSINTGTTGSGSTKWYVLYTQRSTGKMADTTNSTWDTIAAADLADYSSFMAEESTSGIYSVSVPGFVETASLIEPVDYVILATAAGTEAWADGAIGKPRYEGTLTENANMVGASGSSTAADNLELAFTGATYNAAGLTVKTATDVETDTQDIQNRLPAALVSGRMDSSVGAYQTGLTPLQPTTAGRTLDVTAGGEAGIDWANIGSPTTVVNLSGTTVKTATDVETDTQDIQGRLPAALVSGRIDSSVGAYQTGLTPLQPTTAGRTLDVSTGGEAGLDWANIGSPTTVVNLSGTTVKTATDVEADTQDIQSRLPAALTADGNIKADSLRISGSATAADNVETCFTGTITTLDALDTAQDTQHSTTQNSLTTVLARLGSWTGTGVNTLLGAFKALLSKTASNPSDIGGTFDAATDSTEAIRDRGDAAWITGTGTSTLTQADIRTAVGLASANLDTQLADIPTVSEFNARTLPTADYFDAGSDTVTVGAFNTSAKAELQQEATDALNAYDPPTRAEATSDANSILAYVDLIDDGTSGLAKIATDVAAILVDTGTTLDAFIQAIKAKTDNLPASPAAVGSAMTLTSGERNSVADATLNRAASNIESTADKHSLGAVVMIATNASVSGTTLTAKKPSDDSTFQTYTVTVDASADPITGVS